MSVHLCTFLSVLSVYVQYLCVFLLSLLCWMVCCLYWVFVCVCCAAPDKLTSLPPFTGLGALQSDCLETSLRGCLLGTKSIVLLIVLEISLECLEISRNETIVERG